MASMKEIKRRRESIQSTEQITKAMKLVSTVKLQKARARAEESKPYFDLMYETIASILEKSENISHKYLKSGQKGKKAVIVITANRGLAGGYNNNIIKLVSANLKKEDTVVYAVGRKGKEGLERRGYTIAGEYSEVINEPTYQDAADMTKVLLDGFAKGEIAEIYLAYTNFKNTVVHIPTFLKLLPISAEDILKGRENAKTESGPRTLMNYSPNEEEVLNAIVPKYMSSIIYGGLMQALASENGARMNAMDSATNNADELIQSLGLLYNRARQGAITQELTEIVAGANAIN
ncbi:ATP synthase F1 subunit gamma [Lachnospiraceae bacterium oral taxon 096]|jgi:ATP synthase F1, gamma subunit|nr:ATP synthase F1 subunit gamma [Lachnospiraceae bacterium oral taxon 096]QUI96179.1 ATP synthase F1 subunit gamma [Lachnospiraceae bacterium oral taxon 096]